jgi:hypothetical protein
MNTKYKGVDFDQDMEWEYSQIIDLHRLETGLDPTQNELHRFRAAVYNKFISIGEGEFGGVLEDGLDFTQSAVKAALDDGWDY